MLLGEWVVASDMPRAVVTSTETKVSGSGSSSAANADVIFSLAAGTYNYSITGFGKGDVLDFPDGAVPSVDNESFSDGRVNLQWASSGLTITITLTGSALGSTRPSSVLAALPRRLGRARSSNSQTFLRSPV